MNPHPRVSASLLLASFLIAGAVGGILLERTVLSPSQVEASTDGVRFRPRDRPVGRPPVAFHERLTRRLELSDEQAAQVGELVLQSQADMAALLADVKPELAARVDSLTQRIRAVLESEQLATFDLMLADERNRFRRQIEAGLVSENPGSGGPP
jgi:hypothetical protein